MQPHDSTVTSFWLRSPAMREPARIARELGVDLYARFEELERELDPAELRGWILAALTPR